MSGDILTVKTVKRVRSVRGSALVHIMILTELRGYGIAEIGISLNSTNIIGKSLKRRFQRYQILNIA